MPARLFPRHPRSRRDTSVAGAVILMVLAATLIAGCGVSSSTAGSASATPTPTRHGAPPGLTVRPCPGPVGSPPSTTSTVVVLTPNTPNRSVAASMHDVVRIQLPASMRWSYDSTASTASILSQAAPGGIEDTQLNACVWDFNAVSKGTATLHFTGQALCDPNMPCAMFMLNLTLTVTVH